MRNFPGGFRETFWLKKNVSQKAFFGKAKA